MSILAIKLHPLLTISRITRDLEPLCEDPPKLAGDSAEKSVFKVPRPPYQHIKPPHNFNAHDFEQEGNKGVSDNFDISDDEGDLQEGRISPCTFRLWAEGCER